MLLFAFKLRRHDTSSIYSLHFSQAIREAGGEASCVPFDWNASLQTAPLVFEGRGFEDLREGWVLGADLVYSEKQVGE